MQHPQDSKKTQEMLLDFTIIFFVICSFLHFPSQLCLRWIDHAWCWSLQVTEKQQGRAALDFLGTLNSQSNAFCCGNFFLLCYGFKVGVLYPQKRKYTIKHIKLLGPRNIPKAEKNILHRLHLVFRWRGPSHFPTHGPIYWFLATWQDFSICRGATSLTYDPSYLQSQFKSHCRTPSGIDRTSWSFPIFRSSTGDGPNWRLKHAPGVSQWCDNFAKVYQGVIDQCYSNCRNSSGGGITQSWNFG